MVRMLNVNFTSEGSHVLELLYLLQSLCKIPMHSLELGGISLYSTFVPYLMLGGRSHQLGFWLPGLAQKKRLSLELGT